MKALIIVTTETDPYKQLGWYNFNLFEGQKLDIIFVVNDDYKIINVYDLKQTKNQFLYKIDFDNFNNKTVSVNFYEYVTVNNNLNKVKIPKVKNLTICDFDNKTNKFDITNLKLNYKIYDWSKNFKSGDVLWFYQLDSCFTTKNYTPIKIIIDDPIKRSIKVNGNSFNSVGDFVRTALSSFIKMSKTKNVPMTINCLEWIISDREKQNVDKLMKNNPNNINIRQYINKHSSTVLGVNFI